MASPPMVPAASGNQNASLSGPNMNGMKPKMVETTVRKNGRDLSIPGFQICLVGRHQRFAVAGFGCIIQNVDACVNGYAAQQDEGRQILLGRNSI